MATLSRFSNGDTPSANLSGNHTMPFENHSAPRRSTHRDFSGGSRSDDSIVMKVSDCRWEREEALKLVHRIYNRSGLAEANGSGMRVMKQHLADETEILVGNQQGQIVFTVTLVRDGIYGMPLESLFECEVAAMRREGLRMAEVSCLAHDCEGLDSKERFATFASGISLLLQTARRRRVDRLLLAVHPRHAKVYERLFGCQRLSDAKEYSAVRGNPAILCVHDFDRLDIQGYPLYQQMYGNPYDPWQLDGARMSDAEKDYFEQFLPADEHEFIPMAA